MYRLALQTFGGAEEARRQMAFVKRAWRRIGAWFESSWFIEAAAGSVFAMAATVFLILLVTRTYENGQGERSARVVRAVPTQTWADTGFLGLSISTVPAVAITLSNEAHLVWVLADHPDPASYQPSAVVSYYLNATR